MPGQISPLAGKLALFQIGSTIYQWTRWTIDIVLDTGEVLHFDGLTDGAGNYWPTVYTNWAVRRGPVSGYVDAAINPFPISTAGGVHQFVRVVLLRVERDQRVHVPRHHERTTFTGDAAATDPAALDCAFKMTGPPTRVYS
jgi:hypothetical protein